MNAGWRRRGRPPPPALPTGNAALDRSWAELPAASGGSLTELVRLITDVPTIDGYAPRNYAMGYDRAKKAALWVAYPMHGYYTSGSAGSSSFTKDPDLPSEDQMGGTFATTYNRGHQLPNADRKVSSLANKQVYYYSNMTPADRLVQQSDLGGARGKRSHQVDLLRHALRGHRLPFRRQRDHRDGQERTGVPGADAIL